MPGATDRGFGADSLGVRVGTVLADGGREQGSIRVEKFDLDQTLWVARRAGLRRPQGRHFAVARVRPFDVYEREDCNLITAAGWALALNQGTWIAGSAPTHVFDTTHGRIGLGTSSTAPTYADTNLNASSLTGNSWTLCAAAPTYTAASGGTGAKLVFTATFALADAVGTPQEFAVDQGTATGTFAGGATAPMVNHGLATPGTKTASQTWNVTVTLTFT